MCPSGRVARRLHARCVKACENGEEMGANGAADSPTKGSQDSSFMKKLSIFLI